MPFVISQLKDEIELAAERAAVSRPLRESLLGQLARALARDADLTVLSQRLEAVLARGDAAHYRGARFQVGAGAEPANAVIDLGTVMPEQYALIGVDGSQALPDRHASVPWGLAKADAVCIVYGHPDGLTLSGAIQGRSFARFWDESALAANGREGEPMTPADISAERDLMEREHMATCAEMARAAGLPAFVIADGSLMPFALLNDAAWRGPGDRRAWEMLGRLSRALSRIKVAGAIPVGLIDRPNSNAVLRACAVGIGMSHDALPPGLVDRALYAQLLAPGQRGALFDPNWRVNDREHIGRDEHDLCAFYARMDGADPHANVVRVEVPRWATDPTTLDALTAVLARQTRIGAGYPFILKAAHEQAVFTRDEQAQVQRTIEAAFLRRGMTLTPSAKLSAKELR
ncbi:MAG: DNA double-strand break repair nuclease NurA [Thermoflexales bacterium]|nr:DNA double-strand break repair nuclease NurA [Thermoflexales bacterium]